MDHLNREYVEPYHNERPHQGKGNVPLTGPPTTKNHLAADLLLRDDLAAELRAIEPAGERETASVLADRLPDMETFRLDLAAAKIAEADARGRVVDFHAL